MTSTPSGGMPPVALPDEAWVTALVSLSLMGPARLTVLLEHYGPQGAWDALREGLRVTSPANRADRAAAPRLAELLGARTSAVVATWKREARMLEPGAVWAAHVAAGIGVAIPTSAGYPTPFVDDLEPPLIVFSRGDPDALVGPRVAIVGTRDCTRYGYDIAHRLGAELSEAGVSIVSGLALGIDGAAHAGALAVEGAPPIAVVGSGLDVVYPKRNASLWHRVASAGVVLSEYPLGAAPVAWHFPARNRLIAALADVLVVVESQGKGGSMLTVGEALDRGKPHMAVPGPITSKVSAGPNQLLGEGAGVVRDTGDVLLMLGMSAGLSRSSRETRVTPSAQDQEVLDAIDWQPVTFDQVADRTGLDLYDLSLALDRLVEAEWVDRRGAWLERRAKPGG